MSVYSNNRYDKSSPNDAWYKISQFIEPGAKVLDIGCSSGKLGAALKKEKQVHVVGIDIDEADVQLAKKNLDEAHILNIEQDDPTFLGKFDIIIMADVIEHLIDPVAALTKIKHLLDKNGKLVFSIPNMANITTRIELLKGKFEYKDFGLLDRTHLHFYDKDEVERVFKEAGYQIAQTDCTLREIPDDILIKDLEPLGIALNPKLKEALNNSEAITYQFIGWAKPSDKPLGFAPHTTSPLDSVSVYIDELRAQHDDALNHRDQEIKRLAKQATDVQSVLDAIHNSKGWKLLDRFYTAKKKITRNRN